MPMATTVNLGWNNPSLLLCQNNINRPLKNFGKLQAKCLSISKTRMNSKTLHRAIEKPAAAMLLTYDPASEMAGCWLSSRQLYYSRTRRRRTPCKSSSDSNEYVGHAVVPAGSNYGGPKSYLYVLDQLILGAIIGLSASAWVIASSKPEVLNSEKKQQYNNYRNSVMQLQVGLLESGMSVQMDLNHIAKTVNNYSNSKNRSYYETSKGCHYVLTETILSILRHRHHCISVHSSVYLTESEEGAEKTFNLLSTEERWKLFDEKTLVNVSKIKMRTSKIPSSISRFSDERMVMDQYLVSVLMQNRVHVLMMFIPNYDLDSSSRTTYVVIYQQQQGLKDSLAPASVHPP